jgi:hypothetical protein
MGVTALSTPVWLSGALALLGAIVTAARAIWRSAGAARLLVEAVKENTTATQDLAAEFADFHIHTVQTLANHDARIKSLEDHEPGRTA